MVRTPRPRPAASELNAIDTVARQMTERASTSDLRASVLARLEPRRPGRAIWWLVPAAAVTALALVTAPSMLRRLMAPESGAPSAASTSRIATHAVPAAAPAPAPDEIARDVRAAGRPAGRPVSPAQTAWRARAIPALQAIEALSFSTIQPDVLSIPQLEVKPLVTAPIDTGAGDGGSR